MSPKILLVDPDEENRLIMEKFLSGANGGYAVHHGPINEDALKPRVPKTPDEYDRERIEAAQARRSRKNAKRLRHSQPRRNPK